MSKRSYKKKPPAPARSDVRDRITSRAAILANHTPSYLADQKPQRCSLLLAETAETKRGAGDYPYGARIILEPQSPTASKFCELIESALSLKPGTAEFIPKLNGEDDEENIRTLRLWAAARFYFLFDAANPPDWKGDIVQGEEIAQAYRDSSGFDFEMLVDALVWAWRNGLPGGRSGKTSFILLWERNIGGYRRRHRGDNRPISPALRRYAGPLRIRKQPYKIVAYLLQNVFELERAAEWLEGYRLLPVASWKNRALKCAEVSPLAFLWALCQHGDIVQGDPANHAAKNVEILNFLKPKRQAKRDDLPYELCLAHDKVGYLIQTIFWMRKETLRPTCKLSRYDASCLFKLATNMMAWIEPQTAVSLLSKRFRGEQNEIIGNELSAGGFPSMFPAPNPDQTDCDLLDEVNGLTNLDADLPIGQEAGVSAPIDDDVPDGSPNWDIFVADDGLTALGADLVLRLEEDELYSARYGFRDRSRNPLIRAGYCPEAWYRDIGSQAMLDAWICSHDALQRLDMHYASPWLAKKDLSSARRLAITISELPVPPMTDFVFGHRLALSTMFAGKFFEVNKSAENFHLGKKTRISGLPVSKKSFNTNVFDARRRYNSLTNH
jgi:hypothetical protein